MKPRTPWEKTAISEHLPLTVDLFPGSIYEAMVAANRKNPDRRALYFMGEMISGEELTKRVDNCAARFLKIGVRAGDIVTIALPNCLQAVYSIYALNKIGAVSSIIHHELLPGEIIDRILLTKSRLIITLPEIAQKLIKYPGNRYPSLCILITRLEDELHADMQINSASKIYVRNDSPNIKCLRWKSVMVNNGTREFKNWKYPLPSSEDTAVIIYSGGTTGENKGIEITNGNLNYIGKSVIACLPMLRPEKNDTFAVALPIFHGYGLGVGVHCSLYNGLGCALISRFSVGTFANEVKTSKSNILIGVPSMYEKLLDRPSMEKLDWSNIRGVFCGGEKLDGKLEDRIDEYLRKHNASIRVCEGYGLAENLSVATISPLHHKRKGSVGIPIADTYIKIVSPGTDKELPYGQKGEICISSPAIMKGYLGKPATTKACITTDEYGRKWLHTDDAGYMDDDGFLYVISRMSRMFIINGYNFYPNIIEDILNSFYCVEKSYVTDDRSIQDRPYILAYVITRKGVPQTNEIKEEIRRYCIAETAFYSIPLKIIFISSFPTTEVGKISIKELSQNTKKKRLNSYE